MKIELLGSLGKLLSCEVLTDPVQPEFWLVRAWLETEDVTVAGKSIVITMTDRFPKHHCNGVLPPEMVRGVLRRLLFHELDESLRIDGEQLWDPHK